MFSSTELIRKSKTIFDKLNNKSIEKAIILRDGKPGFMLLDFATYEKMMKDYEKLSNKIDKKSEEEYLSLDDIEVSSAKEVEVKTPTKEVTPAVEEEIENTETKSVEIQEPVTQIDDISTEEIDEEELLKALEEIDKMNIQTDAEVKQVQEDNLEDELEDDFQIALDEIKKEEKKEQPLKEFWDN